MGTVVHRHLRRMHKYCVFVLSGHLQGYTGSCYACLITMSCHSFSGCICDYAAAMHAQQLCFMTNWVTTVINKQLLCMLDCCEFSSVDGGTSARSAATHTCWPCLAAEWVIAVVHRQLSTWSGWMTCRCSCARALLAQSRTTWPPLCWQTLPPHCR